MPPPAAWVGTGMPTGVVLRPNPAAANLVDDAIAQARLARAAGVGQIWLGQRVDFDAIGLAGLIGAAVPGLGVGTSVVPVNPRHPLLVASQAQTAQAASHGNFSLGLGLGSHEPERQAFGTSWPDPLDRLREHLTVLRSIFDIGSVDFHGDQYSAAPAWPVAVAGGTPVPVYVAAMGPKALRVSGELADGTMPFLAGPRTIADFIEPTIARAAADAGRPSPRIIAAVPVLITTDVDAGRAVATKQLGFYEAIPSYRRVIARERVDHVTELAAIGSSDAVRRHLNRYLDAGATDVVLNPLDTESVDAERLWDIAASI
jgi:F420-dependent oxidoreductase-like protein